MYCPLLAVYFFVWLTCPLVAISCRFQYIVYFRLYLAIYCPLVRAFFLVPEDFSMVEVNFYEPKYWPCVAAELVKTVECPLIYVHFYLLIKCPIVTFNFIFCSIKSTCLSQLLHTNLFSHVAVYFFLRLYCKFVANDFYLPIKCQLVLVYSFVPIDCYHLCISHLHT